MTRKPGAQPGNTNALKHGYYSHRFNKLEVDDLEVALIDGLVDEIALMRVLIRRVFEYANEEAANLAKWQESLSTLGDAATRLSGMLRVQIMLSEKKQSQVVDVLSQAINEVTSEWTNNKP